MIVTRSDIIAYRSIEYSTVCYLVSIEWEGVYGCRFSHMKVLRLMCGIMCRISLCGLFMTLKI